MEANYSVALVCRENGTCHPLDPGMNLKPCICLLKKKCKTNVEVCDWKQYMPS